MGVILISGATSGIGKETRALLESAGHDVLGVSRTSDEIRADLSVPRERRLAAEAIGEACGGVLDGFFSCAGALVGDTPADVVSLNYFGAIEMLQLVQPMLRASGNATVVVMSSNSATITPDPPFDLITACLDHDEERARSLAGRLTVYSASKFALTRKARLMASEPGWADRGIRLNIVAAGITDTPMHARVAEDPELAELIGLVPITLGRIATPEDIAGAVAFLFSPAASYMHGSVLTVDGGTEALLRGADLPGPWLLSEGSPFHGVVATQ